VKGLVSVGDRQKTRGNRHLKEVESSRVLRFRDLFRVLIRVKL
jgi:hypothetical protein